MASRLQPATQTEPVPPLKGLGLIIKRSPRAQPPQLAQKRRESGTPVPPWAKFVSPSGLRLRCPTLVRRLCVCRGDLARLGSVRRPHCMRPSPPSQRTTSRSEGTESGWEPKRIEPVRAELKLAQSVRDCLATRVAATQFVQFSHSHPSQQAPASYRSRTRPAL